MKPEQYGFTAIDVEIDGLNMKQGYRYQGESFVAAEISPEEGDRLLKCYMGEQDKYAAGNSVASADDSYAKCNKDCRGLLKKLDCHFLLLVWKSQDEEKLLFFSDTRRVRALEFLDYLITDYGLVRGNADCASGQISTAILSVQIAGMDLADTLEYFLRISMSYFEECDWIEAADYGASHREEIWQMKKYYKKRIAWAYVKSTDVVPAGEQIHMKSLENESGLLLTADDDTYIMIGCRGEIYDIKKEKFEHTYESTEEVLDVFEQMLDFLPAVEVISSGDYISLDDVARLCYPKRGTGVYIRELKRRTKVFPASGNMEYFLGMPGDYMAVRLDDFRDIYIIQRDIFVQTYEEGTSEEE